MESPPYLALGMLGAEGQFEHYGLIDTKAKTYHHSWLVQDQATYDLDSTLRYVVTERGVRIAGDSALDPFDIGYDQIATLCRILTGHGFSDSTPIEVSNHHLRSRYDGKPIGVLGHWLRPPYQHMSTL